MTDTPHLGLPLIEASQAQKHVTHNEAIVALDAIVQLSVKDSTHTAPPAAVEGDRYKVASGATGDWAEWDLNIALYTQGAWQKLVPQLGWICFDEATGAITVWQGAPNYWVDIAAAGGYVSGNGETDVASAATCDIGAAPTSRVQVTGTTTITSFSTGENKIRILRFAQALTLTHNAVSLILPGGANITTAAGDTCIAISDASGNWRVLAYQRATGIYIDGSGNAGVGTTTPGISPSAGRRYLTLSGPANIGVLEMTTGAADGDGVPLGGIQFVDRNASPGNQIVGFILSVLQGSTANNRGGYFGMYTKGDNGSLLERFRVNNAGNFGIGTSAPNDRLDVAGNIVPHTDNTYSLGTGTFRWSAVYAATGTINTSDAREKCDIRNSELGLSFVLSLQPRSFRWQNGGAIELESQPRPGRRRHFGFLAQEVKAALDQAGVPDAAMWILTDKNDPNSTQGLRIDQLIAPLVKSVQELAARVEALGSAAAPAR